MTSQDNIASETSSTAIEMEPLKINERHKDQSEADFTVRQREDSVDGDLSDMFVATPEQQGEVFMKKYVVSRLMDVALLMANASQLRVVSASHARDFFFGILLFCITLSIVLQISFALIMICKQRLDDEINDLEKHDSYNEKVKFKIAELKVKGRNRETLSCVFMTFIMVANVLIVGFGLQDNTNRTWNAPFAYSQNTQATEK